MFHWHLSDSQSFPLHLQNLPGFSQYGAYSEDMVYTQQDVKQLLQFADDRGVRIIPELDIPAHVGLCPAVSPQSSGLTSSLTRSRLGVGQLELHSLPGCEAMGGLLCAASMWTARPLRGRDVRGAGRPLRRPPHSVLPASGLPPRRGRGRHPLLEFN